ncbi:hypothetical protein [Niallia sp. 03190]|uniref:hypothetical protein n=1 Tax=Niallia sp. 03190 TaxID=3458061 RepID=UPI004043A4C9
MDLNKFIKIYQEFLYECEQKGYMNEVLIEEFGNYLVSIKNMDGIEVQFFIELDVENSVQLYDTTYQTRLKYGVIRKKGEEESFSKKVLEAFHQCWAKHSPKRKSIFILGSVKR